MSDPISFSFVDHQQIRMFARLIGELQSYGVKFKVEKDGQYLYLTIE